MPGYATLPIMGAEDFRADLRRRRSAQRLSRAALAQRSGVSAPTIEKIEMGKSHPERETVIDLTRALNCDIDEALGAVGYEPLTEEERAGLGRINSPREQLDRMLDELPPSQVYAFLVMARSILNPRALPQADDDPGNTAEQRPVHVQEVRRDSGDYLGDRMRKERERARERRTGDAST